MLETLQHYSFEKYVKSHAGYYVLLNIQHELKEPMSDIDFVRILKDRHEVMATPGSLFGPAAKGYIRISFATEETDIQHGVAAIRECVDAQNL